MYFRTHYLLLVLIIIPVLSTAMVKVESGCVLASLPGTNSSIGLLTLQNDSAQIIEFTGASSDRAERTEFHYMSMRDGVMYMQRIDKLQIAAQRKLKLGLDGTHLMLLDLTSSLQPQQHTNLTLFTGKGDSLTVKLPVYARQESEKCDLPLKNQPVLQPYLTMDSRYERGDTH